MTDSSKKILVLICGLFIGTRLILGFLGFMSLNLIDSVYHTRYGVPDQAITYAHPILKTWAIWDSAFYIKIARDGYPTEFNPHVYNNYGFFPGYPLILSIISFLFKDYVLSGIITSSLACIVGAYFLFRIVEEDYDAETAEKSLYLYFLQPFGFIMSGVFSESLFLMTSLIAVWGMKKNRLFISIIAAMYATLTRPVGLLLLIPLIIILFKRKSPWYKYLSLGFIPLALVGLNTYFFLKSGDFFAYSHTQLTAWNLHLTNPLFPIIDAFASQEKNLLICVTFLLLYALFFVVGIRKLKIEYVLFALPLLFFNTFFDTVLSSPRYGVVVFPIAISGALFLKKESQFRIAMIVLSMFQAGCMIAWALGLKFTA